MILALLGRSGSGKSTLQKELENHGFKKVVMATTRPKREYEVEGEDYYFMSEEEWIGRSYKGEFADVAVYNNWRYGLTIPDTTDDLVVCVTPAGMRRLKRENFDLFSIYIDVDRRKSLIKSLERGDDIDEACRRSLADVGQYDRIEEEVDEVIVNDYKKSVDNLVIEILNKVSKRNA